MKLQKLFSLLFFYLYSMNLAVGGTSVGNGGLAVSCPSSDNTTKLRILDFVEGELRWKLKLKKHASFNDPKEIVLSILDKMATLDPARSIRLTEELKNFYDESMFYTDIVLSRTDDEQNLFVPSGCSVIQAVIQIEPLFPEDRRYNISADIWKKLGEDVNEQAGLILHELLYREAITNGHLDSRRIRYYVAQLFSEDFEKHDAQSYRNLLVSVDFPDLN